MIRSIVIVAAMAAAGSACADHFSKEGYLVSNDGRAAVRFKWSEPVPTLPWTVSDKPKPIVKQSYRVYPSRMDAREKQVLVAGSVIAAVAGLAFLLARR